MTTRTGPILYRIGFNLKNDHFTGYKNDLVITAEN